MRKFLNPLVYLISTSLFLTYFTLVSFRLNNKIHFIDDEKLQTFDQVIKLDQFKGKVLYIDLWGTRCIPCIEEFEFNSLLKERFNQEPVEYLYLAVDYGHSDDRERWKKMVEEKNLTGYHMLLSKDLYKDAWDAIKDNVKEKDMYYIPHYIIVDKEGKIAYAHASRPSRKEVLYKQIQNTLNKSNGK